MLHKTKEKSHVALFMVVSHRPIHYMPIVERGGSDRMNSILCNFQSLQAEVQQYFKMSSRQEKHANVKIEFARNKRSGEIYAALEEACKEEAG